MGNKKLLNKFAREYAKIRYPSGKKDNGGRWYPNEEEICDCCSYVRRPSRSFPWSLYVHCKSIKHTKNLLIKMGITDEDIPLLINNEGQLGVAAKTACYC